MRYGDFMYICQTCHHTEGALLIARNTLNVVIESECRQPMCACDEHTKGKGCRTRPCGGALVLSCRDNYGDFTTLGDRQAQLERLVKRQTEQMVVMSREALSGMGDDAVRQMMSREAAIAVREAREMGVIK